MKVLTGDNYNVYVYPEDHAPPHCHVRYREDEAESVVGIPLWNPIAGEPVDKKIRKTLQQNLEKLIKAWETLNPAE